MLVLRCCAFFFVVAPPVSTFSVNVKLSAISYILRLLYVVYLEK